MTPDLFSQTFHRIRDEIAKVVVGQREAVEQLLVAIFAGGHVLLRGMPGLGRTLIVNTLAQAMGLDYRRIQFTPDLLPTDIIGAEVMENHPETGTRMFRFFKGPVFANLVLVDEINRSPTRTQSALLEVMQERQVTAGGQTHFLPKPFILIATENSLDTEGVWRLGEASLDRFMMSIEQKYPHQNEEQRMLAQTTGTATASVCQVTDGAAVLTMQSLAREVPVVPSVRDFALSIVRGSRPGDEEASSEIGAAVRLGASPRAAQALLLGAKVTALARGRTHVVTQDVIDVAAPVMRHRIMLDVQAQAEGQTVDRVLEKLIATAPARMLPAMSAETRELLNLGRSGA